MIDYEPNYGCHEFVESLPEKNLTTKTEAPHAFTGNGVGLEDLKFADESGLSAMKTPLAKFAFAKEQLNSGKVAAAAERFGNPFASKN